MFGDSGTDRVMLHLEIRKAGKPFDPLQVLPAKP
jgi:septal ring factor EnvC (AmiA/AmiB activator)